MKEYQEPNEGNLCVPKAFFMIIETMRQKVEGIPKLSVAEIAELLETDSDGTVLGDNVDRLNEKFELTNPYLSFYVEYLVPKWQIICDDLNIDNPFKKPVLMMIYQFDVVDINYFPHAVVLLKGDNKWVTYFDPIYGEMIEPTPKFYRQWEFTDRTCARIKIEPRVQKVLEEFIEENGGKVIE